MTALANPHPKPGQVLPDHPIAQIFPMMDQADYSALCQSLEEHGWKGESIVTLEGKVLDGRNRQKAALEVGIAPQYRPYDFTKDGASPTQFVMRRNLVRRHLTPSQRAAVGEEARPFFDDEAKVRQASAASKPRNSSAAATPPIGESTIDKSESQEGPADDGAAPPPPPQKKPRKAAAAAAAATGSSTRSVERARRVKTADPAAFAEVKAGTKTLAEAERKLTAQEKADIFRKEGVARIERVCSASLVEAVRNGVRLKTKPELAAFLALTDDQMREIQGLVEVGWKVAAALKYKAKAPARNHKLSDLLDRAAAAGGTFTCDLDWATITVSRKK